MHARAPTYFDNEKRLILKEENHLSPEPNGKKASRGQSLRKRDGLNAYGSFQ